MAMHELHNNNWKVRCDRCLDSSLSAPGQSQLYALIGVYKWGTPADLLPRIDGEGFLCQDCVMACSIEFFARCGFKIIDIGEIDRPNGQKGGN